MRPSTKSPPCLPIIAENGGIRQKTLDDMDRGSVATAITSPTTLQVIGLDKSTSVRVARESNEYCKKLESDHKGRFGSFAMLPFPHRRVS